MKLQTVHLATDDFAIHESNGLRLIIPKHVQAVANSSWNKDNLWYRSRVETLEGDTISQGFGKFFNLGQGPLELQVTAADIAKACEKNDAVATTKLDGSLLIRSVYDRTVMLRTRGSFGYDQCDNADEVKTLFREKYPDLYNPLILPDYSFLLEWVSPSNQIVIRYPEPELHLVGMVDHSSMKYVDIETLRKHAKFLGVKHVPYFYLTTKGWEDLLEKLETESQIEGYVIRINKEQTLVKVKAPSYLTKHALRSCLTTDKLADLWFQYGQPDYRGFTEQFSKDFDEECAIWAMPAISSMFDGIKTYNRIMNALQEKVAERKAWTRKDFAVAAQNEYGQTKKFSVAMNLFLDKKPTQELLKGLLLQNTKQVEMSFLKKTSTEDQDDQ